MRGASETVCQKIFVNFMEKDENLVIHDPLVRVILLGITEISNM